MTKNHPMCSHFHLETAGQDVFYIAILCATKILPSSLSILQDSLWT